MRMLTPMLRNFLFVPNKKPYTSTHFGPLFSNVEARLPVLP